MFLLNIYYDKRYGKIIASAVKGDDGIYTGKTHADCLIQKPVGFLKGAEQGFITANNVFVNRKLALKIARHYKQITHKHPPYDQLMSEDIVYNS